MNFIEDVLERFPASKPALVAISQQGERRVWAFGELIARSAGLSGAFAARGVDRGDAVMVLAGNRIGVGARHAGLLADGSDRPALQHAASPPRA